MKTEWFALASALIVLAGAPFYLYDILKGTTKPERTTWLIWTMLSLIAFVSQFKLGAHWSLLFVGLEASGNFIVYLLALKYGVGGWRLQDKWALAVAVLGITVSLVTHSPLVALVSVLVADSAGAVLTIYKAFLMPKSETAIMWVFLGLSAALSGASVGHWYLQLLLYPIYLTAMSFLVPIAQLTGWLSGHRATAALTNQSSAPPSN